MKKLLLLLLAIGLCGCGNDTSVLDAAEYGWIAGRGYEITGNEKYSWDSLRNRFKK